VVQVVVSFFPYKGKKKDKTAKGLIFGKGLQRSSMSPKGITETKERNSLYHSFFSLLPQRQPFLV